jgi:hypothetical protein
MITQIQVTVRPDTSISFFNESEIFNNYSGQTDVIALRDSGAMTILRNVGPDGLTQTNIITVDTLANYSKFETACSIELDARFVAYTEEHGFKNFRDTSITPFAVTGIVMPFVTTVVYTWPTPDSSMQIFASSMSLQDGFTVLVGDNTVSVARRFDNAADYTTNYLQDLVYVTQLYAKGVTRTITHEYV